MESNANYYNQSPQYHQQPQHSNECPTIPQASYQAQRYPIEQPQEFSPAMDSFTISKQNSSYIVSMQKNMER